jgi:hypothetical protein
MKKSVSIIVLLVATASGCEEVPDGAGGGGGAGDSSSGTGGDSPSNGQSLAVPTVDGPVYVDLDTATIVDADAAWELRFDGLELHTNGGASGEGNSKALGPLAAQLFVDGSVPSTAPFLIEDAPGGAFDRWFAYDGSTHQLFSRFHVIGLRKGDELYKVQILGFYGELDGAPVSGLFRLRYAGVRQGEVGPTQLVEGLDGTAGGSAPTEADPSGCIRLSDGAQSQLTPAEAAASDDWDLCFRRATITVNGGQSGPGSVEAVNLSAAALDGEDLGEVKQRTAESELAAFDQVGHERLSDPALVYRPDGVISAFTGRWYQPGTSPLEPSDSLWLVAGADGETPFAVGFDRFDGATSESPGTVQLQIIALTGSLP